jgi:radical SAM superfamily enzyme YgiQ (UPF0313 family)
LAGADVLHQPVDQIVDYLSLIGSTFPIEPRIRGKVSERDDAQETPRFDGVHVFLDDFASPLPDRAGWHELAASGLVRVSMGVESGDPTVREIYRKHWDDSALRVAVADCKAVGLGLSVLTLVGAGGSDRAEAHVDQTVRLIESLDLGAGDFVFLLDEKETASVSSAALPAIHGLAWATQLTTIKDRLVNLKTRGIKVLPYSTDKQWK